MTETILKILLKGAEIFSDERRRQIARELEEKTNRVNQERNNRFPAFNNDRLNLAEQELESFLAAFEVEFGKRLDEVLNKAFSNG